MFFITLLLVFKHSLAFPESINTSNKHIPEQLQYDFFYSNETKTLDVVLKFKGSENGNTMLELPSTFGGVDKLYNNVINISAQNLSLEKTENPQILALKHKPNQDIVLHYRVKQGWIGPFADFQKFLAPIFQNNYFNFSGNGVLVYPQSFKHEKKLFFKMNWKLPNKWQVTNSYGIKNNHQEFIASLDDVLYSLFISGDYHFYNTKAQNNNILITIHGKWSFQEQKFSQTVEKIINNERSFWNDHNFPYFLVSLIPVKTDTEGMAGTGLTNAFILALKSNHTLDYPVWYVISHEAFHTWNRPDIFEVTEKNQVYYYWFSEGFTDYYADLLNLRLGLITLPEYIKNYNKVLVDYYISPVSSSTIEQVKENFWKNFAMQKLPYQQGRILANNWNTQIKLASDNNYSLDNFMRAVINFSKNNSKINLEKMSHIAKDYKKHDLTKDIQNIYSGKKLTPAKNALGSCVNLSYKITAPYSPGFDINLSKEKHKILFLNPNSRAHAAGLRENQNLVSIKDYPDDISKMIEITIKENDLLKTVKYYPYKGEKKIIPQYILDQSKWKTHPEHCLVWFK